MANPKRTFSFPFKDKLLNNEGLLSDPWLWFIRQITDSVQGNGFERTAVILNDISAKSFATTDVNTSTDTITETSHNYYTGLVGQVSSSGSLPGGLSTSTDYYVIKLTANTYQLASSLANANAGTAVNLTSVGSGTHTFTPRADISDLRFDKKGVSASFVDFCIQRVTTGTGATELVETGLFVCSYNPTSDDWSLTVIGTPGPDDSGVDLLIDADGQGQYRSSLISGTESISRIFWKARTLGGKHSSYSQAGSQGGR